VLEDEGPGLSVNGADGVYYRRFGPANLSFGTPALVSSEQHESLTGADQLSASQDSAGGVYATWADQRGFLLSYSPTGGASWPLPQRIGLTQSASDVNVAGVGAGNAELAYTAGPNEYLVPVSYQLGPYWSSSACRSPAVGASTGAGPRKSFSGKCLPVRPTNSVDPPQLPSSPSTLPRRSADRSTATASAPVVVLPKFGDAPPL
jgi:hypothetical protein